MAGGVRVGPVGDMYYTPSGVGAVDRDVEGRLQEIVSVLDFMTPNQRANVLAKLGTVDVTAAITAAIGTGLRGVYMPAGTYKVSSFSLPSYTRLFGAGYATKILSDGSASNTVVIDTAVHVTIDNLRVSGNAGSTNLCGIYGNGAIWTTLENLTVESNGSHGIQFTDTGTANIGCYPVFVRGVHSRSNGGDGYRQVATSGAANQQNAVFISQCEFQQNAGNGLTLWGLQFAVTDNVVEGNTGYGIYLDNGLTSGLYSAVRISITENYFELNYAGHIGARVGVYGVIVGLSVLDNFMGSNSLLLGVGFVPVKVTNYSSLSNAIRDLQFSGNVNLVSGTGLTTYADFGSAPNGDSFIRPHYAAVDPTDITTVPSKYTNLGAAAFRYIKKLTLNGYFQAKGGSGVTYTATDKSDSITVSGSSTFFPLQIPMGARLQFAAVPVETDCAAYTITFRLRSRAYNTTAALATVLNATGTGAATQLVRSALMIAYAASDIVNTTNFEWTLEVIVTWAAPGTYFYLGSPSLYFTD